MINTGDTARVLASTALVLLMTPGLSLSYGGMVRKKNLLSTMMMSFLLMAVIGILWVGANAEKTIVSKSERIVIDIDQRYVINFKSPGDSHERIKSDRLSGEAAK